MLRTIVLIIALAAVQGRNECVRKSFGPGAIVCVCNSTYCDTVTEPDELQENEILWYKSTKDGQRLQLSISSFFPTDINDDKNNVTLTLDNFKRYQMIQGFGAAMTDAAALNIRTLSNKTQHNLLETYYGWSGSKYTFCRIPIAGTDFSTRPYTYDDTYDDNTLSNFNLVEEDIYKINYLHHIKSIMPDPNSLRIFTTSWSAPVWMKTSGSIRYGSLKPQYYQLYAEYIKKFFDAYKERGVNIWGMTPGNEPLNGLFPFFPFNSMFWSPKEEANWSVNNLAPTLSKGGYTDLVYMAMDDQRFELPWYPDIVFENKTADKLFSGIAFHWYADNYFSPMRLTQMHNDHPEKFILMTEACTGSYIWERPKVSLGSWDRGQEYILDIIENLSHWVTGWVDWNIALDVIGGPNWAKNFVDSPIIVIPETDEFYKQPMYYALSHVSRFVPRGSYRIATWLNNENLRAIAFSTPEQKTVIVIVNISDKPVAVTVKNKNNSNMINLEIPANSFNTLVYLE